MGFGVFLKVMEMPAATPRWCTDGEVVNVREDGSFACATPALGATTHSAEMRGNLDIHGDPSTVPTLVPMRSDTTTGIGANAVGHISIIAADVEDLRLGSAATFSVPVRAHRIDVDELYVHGKRVWTEPALEGRSDHDTHAYDSNECMLCATGTMGTMVATPTAQR